MKKSNGALEAKAAIALTMDFTDEQTAAFIELTEKRLKECMAKVQDLEGPRQEAFDKYEKLQAEYDAYKERARKEQVALDNLTRYKNGIKKHVPIRLVRGSSHNDMKPKEVKKLNQKRVQQFTWMAYAKEVLNEQHRMLPDEELWKLVVEKFDIVPRIEAMGSTEGKIKWGAINNCWLHNAERTMEGIARNGGVLFRYNDCFGLKEWATEDWKPNHQLMIKKAV